MLSQKNRLAKTKDIKMVLAKGQNFFNPFFTLKALYFSKNAERDSKFTVVVSVKSAKLAVRRNRIKRILRPWIRQKLKEFRPGDYMVIVKPKAVSLPDSLLTKELENLCRTKKLLS